MNLSVFTSKIAIRLYVGIIVLALGAFGLSEQGCSFAAKFGFGDIEACAVGE